MAKNDRPKWDYNMADNPSGDTARTTVTPPLAPPATEAGALPAVWTGGDTPYQLSPNAPGQSKAKLWYPQTYSLAQGASVNVSADGIPDRWLITLTSTGTAAVYALPDGAGQGLNLFAQGITIRIPGTSPVISIVNTYTGTVDVVVIAIAGYHPLEGMGYITGTAQAGGGASNVTIVGPVNGSGFVEVSVQGSVPVTGTFWQATQPVSGTVGISGTVPVSGTFWQATQPVSGTVGISGTVPVSGTFWQATQPVSGTFWQATQPVSISANKLATSPFNGQVTVAATQTVLSTTHTLVAGYVSVKAFKTNTGNVFIGATGVTTSTGDCLEPGDVRVYPIDDPSLLFCIGTASDKISWYAS